MPSDDLPNTFLYLGELLTPNGIFYYLFKYGNIEQNRHDRFFADMNKKTLADTLYVTKLSNSETWISSDARPGREAKQWLNAILVKA